MGNFTEGGFQALLYHMRYADLVRILLEGNDLHFDRSTPNGSGVEFAQGRLEWQRKLIEERKE